MFQREALPEPYEVSVYGSGKSRIARELYRAGKSVDTIVVEADMIRGEVVRAVRQVRGIRYAQLTAKAKAAEAEAAPFVTGPNIGFDGPMRCSL